MIDLSNQTAIVTGASRGIGAATAQMLARAGANVIVCYRKNQKAAEKIVRNIEKSGSSGITVRCRVESTVDCRRVVNKALKKYKRVDILVNSAGIWEYGPIDTMTEGQWSKTLSVNLTGTFNMCRQVIPIMKKQRYGRIINISSTAGQRGESSYSHYAASKGGIIAFTKSIAVELIHDRIWVNCIAPGWVLTDMTAHVFSNQRSMKKNVDGIPRKKVATPEEIAGPVVFLSSSLSDNIVGEILNVNGGSVL